MLLEAYTNEAVLICDGTPTDWERLLLASKLMMEELPLQLDSDWEGEYMKLSAIDEVLEPAEIEEAYEDAYIAVSLRDRSVTP